jgi:hypothetical protein
VPFCVFSSKVPLPVGGASTRFAKGLRIGILKYGRGVCKKVIVVNTSSRREIRTFEVSSMVEEEFVRESA